MCVRHYATTDVPALQYQQISGKQVSFALLDPSREMSTRSILLMYNQTRFPLHSSIKRFDYLMGPSV